MVTFLCKSLVILIIQLSNHEIKSMIPTEIKKGGIFTVQLDSRPSVWHS